MTPEVLDGELEPGSSVWCYCCECEVVKHISDRETTVVWGGMVEHMRRCVSGCSVGRDG